MKFFRTHINSVNWLTTGGFILSWILMAIVLPVKILGFAESHSVYSVFNADEGCFELVVDHHQDAEGFHLMEKDNDVHSFHNSCCFDDLALTFKKQEADFDLPLSFEPDWPEFNLFSQSIFRSLTLQEYPLPPPESFQVLRITRLLI